MVKTSYIIAFVTILGAFSPAIANAAPLFTPHSQLVREINHNYGTQFKVPAQPAHTASTSVHIDQSKV